MNQIDQTNQLDQRGGEPIMMLVAPARTKRDERVPLIEALLETHRWPLLLMLVGSAAYMALQIFLHKELRYLILDLCVDSHLSPFLLTREDCSCYITLHSFPHKDFVHSILV